MLINLFSENIVAIAIFFSGVLIYFSFSEILKAEKQLMLEAETMLDKRLWYTPTDIHNFFKQVDKTPEGRNIYIYIHKFPDVVFPLAYGIFFAALIFYLHDTKIDWKLAIPMLTTVFDLGENFTTIRLAKTYPKIDSSLAWLACGCTFIKWIMFVFSVILIAIGLFK